MRLLEKTISTQIFIKFVEKMFKTMVLFIQQNYKIKSAFTFHIFYLERKELLIKVSVSLHTETLNDINFINHFFEI